MPIFKRIEPEKMILIYTFINPAMDNRNSGSVSAIGTLTVSHYLGHQSRNTIQRCTGE
jgi:hypothetical protein